MIEQDTTYRPRVPHETRRLLIAALAALLSMWALAQIRYPDAPASANPVEPLLSQLTPRLRFQDLAAQIAGIRSRIDAVVQTVGGSGLTAIRVRDGVVLALAHADGPFPTDLFARVDRASGLGLIETSPDTPGQTASLWSPTALEQPRYLIGASSSSTGLRLTPTLVSALQPAASPAWREPIWAINDGADLAAGALVFTEDAQFVGAVWSGDGMRAIVPATTLIAEAERLLAAEPRAEGWLGVNVTPLTPALARATGARAGVVVASLDPRSPAASSLRSGDVVESIDDEPTSMPHWRARERRVEPGDRLALRVRRTGELHDVTLAAVAPPPAIQPTALGLDLRRVARGSEVQRAAIDSVSHAAGVRPGDVIVQMGDTPAPNPTQVRRVFAASPAGQPVLVVIERAGVTHVITLENNAPEQP